MQQTNTCMNTMSTKDALKIRIEAYASVHNVQVSWGDMDAFQHINNVVYFRYFEDARIAYFKAAQVLDYMQQHRIGPVVAATQCQYLSPLTYPAEIKVAARIAELSAKRLRMDYAIFKAGHDAPLAIGAAQVVYFDHSTQRSCEIPASIVAVFERIEGRRLVSEQG